MAVKEIERYEKLIEQNSDLSMILVMNGYGYDIPMNLLFEKINENDYEFRRDFVARYNPAQGFANVTLAILHEIGHFKTQYDGHAQITFWRNRNKVFNNQKKYMLQENERRATDWAIQWLYDPEHRRLAKQFEKEYFGY